MKMKRRKIFNKEQLKKLCHWCRNAVIKNPKWEQKDIYDQKYYPLCKNCETKRLNNPANALIPMRKIVR